MSSIQEKANEIAGKLRKPHVNSTCIGCGACTAISGDVFDLDHDGLSTVKSLENYEGHDVDDAISACPVNAISWQPCDASGVYAAGVAEHQDVASVK